MLTADAELEAPAARPYRPWLQRRIDASGLPLAMAGTVIAILQLASFFGWMGLGWTLGFGDRGDAWFWEQMVGPNVAGCSS